MADNIDITPGSGRKVATDERTIDGVPVHVQRVNEQGATAIDAGRVTVTSAGGEAIAARGSRKRVTMLALPTNTQDIDVGESGITAGAGFPLAPGASLTLHTTAAVHADTASGNQVLAYIEEYDS
jgi:formyltetrahydrofolate synthetase